MRSDWYGTASRATESARMTISLTFLSLRATKRAIKNTVLVGDDHNMCDFTLGPNRF